jgi:hypothetical protein
LSGRYSLLSLVLYWLSALSSYVLLRRNNVIRKLHYPLLSALAACWLAAVLAAQPGEITGGLIGASTGEQAPDGTRPDTPLPKVFCKPNISSSGLGCCVFRSLEYAAQWQRTPSLYSFPEWMVSKRIPGGGYPQKVDKLIPQIAKDRGMPTPDYIQIQSNDLEILKLALKTGRVVCMTYGISSTGRYNGRPIAHMVCCMGGPEPGQDGFWFICDNNPPYNQSYEILTSQEFLRSYSYGSATGWAVVLLDSPPPPLPKNKVVPK